MQHLQRVFEVIKKIYLACFWYLITTASFINLGKITQPVIGDKKSPKGAPK